MFDEFNNLINRIETLEKTVEKQRLLIILLNKRFSIIEDSLKDVWKYEQDEWLKKVKDKLKNQECT